MILPGQVVQQNEVSIKNCFFSVKKGKEEGEII